MLPAGFSGFFRSSSPDNRLSFPSVAVSGFLSFLLFFIEVATRNDG